MSKPSAVVFDLGNVLLDFDYGIAVKRLEPRCTIPAAELHALINQSALLHRFESGQMDAGAFFAEVQGKSGFKGEAAEFAEIFGNIFKEVPSMTAWNDALRAAGIPTYLFSNTNELSVRHIAARFPFYQRFTGHVLSYKHGAMKPAASIYNAVERFSGFKGWHLLYIDDRLENIEGAAARGWQTIHHSDPARTLETARGLGL